jgi:hypothetical protein
VYCNKCRKKYEIVYLDYLKIGSFRLGEAEIVEVPQSYASGFNYVKEQTTPIIIEVKCDQCGSTIEVKPVSLEYLLFTLGKRKKSEQIYG